MACFSGKVQRARCKTHGGVRLPTPAYGRNLMAGRKKNYLFGGRPAPQGTPWRARGGVRRRWKASTSRCPGSRQRRPRGPERVLSPKSLWQFYARRGGFRVLSCLLVSGGFSSRNASFAGFTSGAIKDLQTGAFDRSATLPVRQNDYF